MFGFGALGSLGFSGLRLSALFWTSGFSFAGRCEVQRTEGTEGSRLPGHARGGLWSVGEVSVKGLRDFRLQFPRVFRVRRRAPN